MKKQCSLKCQDFFRCADAKEGRPCMYDINEDDGDAFLDRLMY